MGENEKIDHQAATAEAQLRKLQLEINKLTFDVESQGSTSFQAEKFMRFVPLVTVIIAVAGFWFTVHQYNQQQATSASKLAADREQALLKPFLDKRLELYFAASEAAATMALSKDKGQRDQAELKLVQLYAGTLIIVEDQEVEGAMLKIYKCITGEDQCDEAEKQRRSQALASRARDSIGKSYNIKLGDLKGKY
jgi:hypothetical protein